VVHQISLPILLALSLAGWTLTTLMSFSPATAASCQPAPTRGIPSQADAVSPRHDAVSRQILATGRSSRPQWDVSIGRGYILHTSSFSAPAVPQSTLCNRQDLHAADPRRISS
jgi:hypothetical protein